MHQPIKRVDLLPPPYTYYKVALAHIYAIFSKHSAELLLCISCDDSLYILSYETLFVSLAPFPFRSRPSTFCISYLSICSIHFANTSSGAARPMHTRYKMFCRWNWLNFRHTAHQNRRWKKMEKGKKNGSIKNYAFDVFWTTLCLTLRFAVRWLAHLHYRQVIC